MVLTLSWMTSVNFRTTSKSYQADKKFKMIYIKNDALHMLFGHIQLLVQTNIDWPKDTCTDEIRTCWH